MYQRLSGMHLLVEFGRRASGREGKAAFTVFLLVCNVLLTSITHPGILVYVVVRFPNLYSDDFHVSWGT